MPNNKRYQHLRAQAQDAYLAGTTDSRVLAEQFDVSIRTIDTWKSKGKWVQMGKEQLNLEYRADQARKKAIVKALEEFANDPKNVALQSLVSLLKNEARRLEPSKDLNNYIIKFLDQLTDFCIEKEYPGLLKDIQSITHELAEYLRIRNS